MKKQKKKLIEHFTKYVFTFLTAVERCRIYKSRAIYRASVVMVSKH